MTIKQPLATDPLNSPDHALSHRVFAIDGSSPVESIVVDASGNVGIGTTVPGLLGVTKELTLEAKTATNQVALNLSGYGTTNEAIAAFLQFYNNANRVAYIGSPRLAGADTSAGLVFVTANAGSLGERMRIDNTGNVGIGTTSPSQLLTVGNNNQFTVSSAGALVSQTATIGATGVAPIVVSGSGLYNGSSPNGAYTYIGQLNGANEYRRGTDNFYIYWDSSNTLWKFDTNHASGWTGWWLSGSAGTPPSSSGWTANGGPTYSIGSLTTAVTTSSLVVDSAGNMTTGGVLSVNGLGNSYILGNVGIGTTGPTAILQIKAGTATAGTAPFKLTPGVLLITPEIGAMEYTDDGTTGHLYFTVNIAGVATRVLIM